MGFWGRGGRTFKLGSGTTPEYGRYADRKYKPGFGATSADGPRPSQGSP